MAHRSAVHTEFHRICHADTHECVQALSIESYSILMLHLSLRRTTRFYAMEFRPLTPDALHKCRVVMRSPLD